MIFVRYKVWVGSPGSLQCVYTSRNRNRAVEVWAQLARNGPVVIVTKQTPLGVVLIGSVTQYEGYGRAEDWLW